MKISHRFGLAAALATALLATSATATVYSVGSPYGGLFIDGSAPLNDLTSRALPATYASPDGTIGMSYVGTGFGVFSGLDGSSNKSWGPLSANGYTRIVPLGNYGVEAVMFDFGHSFSPSASMNLNYTFIGVNNNVLASGVITGLKYRAYDNLTAYFGGNLITEVRLSGVSSFGGTEDSGLYDNFFIAGRKELTGGVPEPATWGLMILGFASIGAMLRSRRKLVPATA